MSLRVFKDRLLKNDQISLVYFIGRSPTQRRRFSFRRTTLTAIIALLLVLIGSLGTMLTLVIISLTSDKEEQLLARQAELLGLQIRYENVFEKAYQLAPEDLPADDPAALAASANNVTLGPIAVSPEESTGNLSSSTEENAEAAAAPLPPPVYAQDLFLKEVRMIARGDRTIANILLQNTNDLLKTGYLYAVASYTTADGTLEYVSAPDPQMVFRKDGSLLDHTLGHEYKMRRKKFFELDFLNPRDGLAKLNSLTIYVTDLQGRLKLRYSAQPLFIILEDTAKLAH